MRAAIYESIPRGERALPLASAALVRDREGAGAERQLTLARRVGTPRTVGIALRAHAAAARDQAGETLAEAISLLESVQDRHDLAQARHDLAQARHVLVQARQELLAAGARPRRTAVSGPDALTSAGRRVAGPAADGLSNRQIAQHLSSGRRPWKRPQTRHHVPGRPAPADTPGRCSRPHVA